MATAELAPGQIGAPIRGILRSQRNTTVLMAEVTGVDKENKLVQAKSLDHIGLSIPYDYLILATGATHSYFGHDEFAEFAPGLKTLADAVAIRNKILRIFEQAETNEPSELDQGLLTFVLVGAGPTGVEMASAIAILIRSTLRTEFRHFDPSSVKVILVDRSSRILGSFSEDLSEAAMRHLESLGVEVRLGQAVDQIDADGVVVNGERINSNTVFWTAGVAASLAGRWLNAETDRSGRVLIQPDLTVPGHPEVFVLGDTALFEQEGKPLAGVAQVAMQQGVYAGRLINSRIAGKAAPPSFRYFDKGTMAVVGNGYAVLQTGNLHLKGLIAWLAWAMIHIQFLALPNLRLSVFLQWMWLYLTQQPGSSLIVEQDKA